MHSSATIQMLQKIITFLIYTSKLKSIPILQQSKTCSFLNLIVMKANSCKLKVGGMYLEQVLIITQCQTKYLSTSTSNQYYAFYSTS